MIGTGEAVALLQSISDDQVWLLQQIEAGKGWLRFPRELSDAIRALKIENYPALYEDELLIQRLPLVNFIGVEAIKNLSDGYERTDAEDRPAFIKEFLSSAHEAIESIHLPRTPEEKAQAKATFEAMTPEQQQEQIKREQYFFASFLSSFHQTISVMVHGHKLTSLVVAAKEGSEVAFAKAVRVDGRILTQVPYFRERYEAARTNGEQRFLQAVAQAQRKAPYQGRIRHKSLWLAFSLLEQFGLLDSLKHRELLDLLDDSGFNRSASRIEDVNYLTKRLGEYRRFQAMGQKSMQ